MHDTHERIPPGHFGYEFDVLPSELQFCHMTDGTVVIRPPEGKKVGGSYTRKFLAAAKQTSDPFQEIEQLRQQMNTLAKALLDIYQDPYSTCNCSEIAKAALNALPNSPLAKKK
jgi:hypothetical protein